MNKDNSIKDYISKAKTIINDDKKLKKLIDDVLNKLKELSNDENTTSKLNNSLRVFIRIINMFLGRQYA